MPDEFLFDTHGASGYSHSQNHSYVNAFNYREYLRRVGVGKPAVENLSLRTTRSDAFSCAV
jgi:hypothetical protein